MIIFILIPAAYADIDDSSTDLAVVDESSDDLAVADDSSGENLLADDDYKFEEDEEFMALGEDDEDDWTDEMWEEERDDLDDYVYDEEKEYNSLLKSFHSPNSKNYKKTILDPAVYCTHLLNIRGLFLDNHGKPLKNTKVIFLVNGFKLNIKTDSRGYGEAAIASDLHWFNITLINRVTGESYTFPGIYVTRGNYSSSYTGGIAYSGNVHYFTINSNGVKSTIKNDEGIVSKAVTYTKGNVIISTKTNKNGDDSSSDDNGNVEKIVIDRFTRYLIYLIAVLCIALPIGILRYKKGSK